MQPSPALDIQEEHGGTIGEEHYGNPQGEADKRHGAGAAVVPGPRDDMCRHGDEELEESLRDDVQELVRQGMTEEAAFRQVAAEMGRADDIGAEFHRAHTPRRSGRPSWRAPRFVPALAWDYFRVAVRKFRRQKFGALINLSGLAKYDNYRKMLRKADIDMVHICTPTFLHAEMAIAGGLGASMGLGNAVARSGSRRDC
jgi:hypothetical protein